MKEKQTQETAVSDFASDLFRKGYRADFKVTHTHDARLIASGRLAHCLTSFLMNGILDADFRLETHAPYEKAVTCQFKMAYDPVKGFLVRQMIIRDAVSKNEHQYNLVNNQQIPGANSLQGLFPKPKPWEHLFKRRPR